LILSLLAALCAGSVDTSGPLWTTSETCVAAGSVVAAALLLPADESIHEWFADHRTEASRTWASVSKKAGDGYLLAPAAVLWLAGADGRAPRLARASRNGLESWCVTELLIQVGKYGLHRKRPSESGSAFQFGGPGITSGDLSFPSGHSGSVWGLLPAYALEYSDHPWLAASCYAVASSTSLSRVHDGQHWASDVAFSAGLGLVVNMLVRDWNQRRDSRLSLVADLDHGTGIRLVWHL